VLARVYGIRPGDLDDMPPGEIRAFLDDLAALEQQQRG